jgi:hypothetical protein
MGVAKLLLCKGDRKRKLPESDRGYKNKGVRERAFKEIADPRR